ncbi:MAG: O-methyltransferase [Planctomycetota bacterium]
MPAPEADFLTALDEYNRQLHAAEDSLLRELRRKLPQAGLPEILITADVGRLLQLLVGLTAGKRVLELGTLGGYSGIWIARGMRKGGLFTTCEINDKHADFAQGFFDRAKLAVKTRILRGAALDSLKTLRREPKFDFIFIDADKENYPAYFKAARPLLAKGGIIAADNTLGLLRRHAEMANPKTDKPHFKALRAYNALVAKDKTLRAIILPIRDGVTVGHDVG